MKKIVLALVFCLTAGIAQGQDPDLVLDISDDTTPVGGTFVLEVLFDNTGTQNVDGWSYGACIADPSIIDPVALCSGNGAGTPSADAAECSAVSGMPQPVSATANGGGNLGFESKTAISGAGWTHGVVIDLFGVNKLAPGTGYLLAYLVGTGTSSGTSSVDICNTLGAPPVADVIVILGASIQPTEFPGSVTVLSPNFLTAETVTGLLGGTVDTDVLLTNVDPVAGLQLSIAYDSALVSPTGAVPTGAASGACFFDVQPGSPAGELAIGLVMDFGDPPCGQAPIPAGTDQPVVTISWQIDAGAPTPSTSPVSFVDGLGSPPVNNILVFEGGSTETPNLVDGAINIVNFNPFIRGDCNQDALVNIADGVYVLNYIFGGGPALSCEDACDFNDDGTVDSTDAIQVFNYQLQPMSVCASPCPPPAAPFPTAGIDPTPNSVDSNDDLGCNGDADDGLSTVSTVP